MAREALADVRATASGYREVSLGSEISVAASVLRAAGISADAAASGGSRRSGCPRALRLRGARGGDQCGAAFACQPLHDHGRESDTVEIRDDGVGAASCRPDRVGAGGARPTGCARQAARVDAGPIPAAGSRYGPRLPDPTVVCGRQADAAGRRRTGPVTRILIADDQAMIRGAFAALLALEADFTWSPRSAPVIRSSPRRCAPDRTWPCSTCRCPGMDGLAAASSLREQLPACKVIILTTFGRPGYLRRAMEAGAVGFLVKDAPPEQLIDAIRRVRSGLRVVDPALAAETLSVGDSPLTGRERDVSSAAADGGTVAEIAARLYLSEGTVRNHLSSVIGKTNARTRADAARIATENGWL